MKKLYSTAALALVLSVSGAMAAQAHGQAGSGTNNGQPSFLEETIAKLPADDAARFRDTMQHAHEKNMAIADQVHELHDALDDIMKAEPFDKKAFRDKSAKLRAVYDQMRLNTDEAFAEASAELPQEEREQVATAMSYPHKKHSKGPGTPSAAQ